MERNQREPALNTNDTHGQGGHRQFGGPHRDEPHAAARSKRPQRSDPLCSLESPPISAWVGRSDAGSDLRHEQHCPAAVPFGRCYRQRLFVGMDSFNLNTAVG